MQERIRIGERILMIVIDYRGHHWKGIIIYNNTEVSLEQKCVLSCSNVKHNTILMLTTFLFLKICSVYLFEVLSVSLFLHYIKMSCCVTHNVVTSIHKAFLSFMKLYQSAASFCYQVAACLLNMFSSFNVAKIANLLRKI